MSILWFPCFLLYLHSLKKFGKSWSFTSRITLKALCFFMVVIAVWISWTLSSVSKHAVKVFTPAVIRSISERKICRTCFSFKKKLWSGKLLASKARSCNIKTGHFSRQSIINTICFTHLVGEFYWDEQIDKPTPQLSSLSQWPSLAQPTIRWK